MGTSKKQWTPFQLAFLDTARRLDDDGAWRNTGKLAEAAMLGLIRRLALGKLAGQAGENGELPEPDDDDSISKLYDFAERAECPLLDDELAPRRPTSKRRAVGLARVPDGRAGLGEVLSGLRDVELVRRRSGKGGLYLRKSPSRRRHTGMFFTPDWLAERLVCMALDPFMELHLAGARAGGIRILDPACGSGRLLTASVRRIALGGGDASDKDTDLFRRLIKHSIRGIDIDPLAVAIARTSLWLQANPAHGPVEGLSEAVIVGDAIGGPLAGRRPKGAVDWKRIMGGDIGGEAGFDVIVANPPFEVLKGFAHRKGLKGYVERIRRSGYDHALHGNLNTYRLFLERALAVLKEDGRMAFILPYGFMMDRTAGPLRAHLIRSGWIRRLEAYPESSRAFEDVGQSIVLLSAAKSRGASPKIAIADGTGEVEDFTVSEEELSALDEEQLPIPVLSPGSFGLAARLRASNASCFGDLADGRVGEVDQTVHARFMRSKSSGALLLRGIHLSPYASDLSTGRRDKRWLDHRGFERTRGEGKWRSDIEQPRVVQTGIVNMEAARRLVAARVPAGVFCGNSVNYWVPRPVDGWEQDSMRAYILGLLNSTPFEWRFRLTSSNNNINLYEIRTLPVPRMKDDFPADMISSFIEHSAGLIARSRSSVLGTVRQITAGWGSPSRADRAVGMLIGRVASMREREENEKRAAWLEAVLDHLVNWHLGMDEPDLERMLQSVPVRRLEEEF